MVQTPVTEGETERDRFKDRCKNVQTGSKDKASCKKALMLWKIRRDFHQPAALR